jgi:predicted outer membrane protein
MINARHANTALALLLVAACRAEQAGVRGDTTALLHADSANATSLSAPQVVTLVSALDVAEIGAANAALPRLGNKLTQAFAQAMIREHGAMDSTIKALPAHGEPMPVPPPQVSTMQAAAKSQGDLLGAMTPGPSFERSYIASQVADHQMALDSLTRWRQVVHDPALAAVLEQRMTTVRAHLAQARSIQSALGGGDTTGMTPSPALLKKPDVQKPSGELGTKKPDTTVSSTPKKP